MAALETKQVNRSTRWHQRAKAANQVNCQLDFISFHKWIIHLLSALCNLVTSASWGQQQYHSGQMKTTQIVYEILQLPLDDEEFFGGLCGGRKDLERFKLFPLLELLPDDALLATE